MGDEDEDQPESNLVWLNYFLKPIENATQIICTEKANGEAAHLSARFIKNKVSILGEQFFYREEHPLHLFNFLGSKIDIRYKYMLFLFFITALQLLAHES